MADVLQKLFSGNNFLKHILLKMSLKLVPGDPIDKIGDKPSSDTWNSVETMVSLGQLLAMEMQYSVKIEQETKHDREL